MKIHGDSFTKMEVIARDGWGCKMCPEWRMSEMTLDHIKPLSMGGHTRASNVQLLCRKCHDIKDKDTGVLGFNGRKRFKQKMRKLPWNQREIQRQIKRSKDIKG